MKFQKLEAINSIPCHLIPNMWTQKFYVWRTPKCDGTLKCNGTTTSDSLPKTPMFWLAKVRWSACIRIFFAQHMYTSLFSQFPGVKTFPSYHCWFLQLVSFPHRVDSEYVVAMSPMTSPWRGVTYIFRQHWTLAWQAIGL